MQDDTTTPQTHDDDAVDATTAAPATDDAMGSMPAPAGDAPVSADGAEDENKDAAAAA